MGCSLLGSCLVGSRGCRAGLGSFGLRLQGDPTVTEKSSWHLMSEGCLSTGTSRLAGCPRARGSQGTGTPAEVLLWPCQNRLGQARWGTRDQRVEVMDLHLLGWAASECPVLGTLVILVAKGGDLAKRAQN